MEKLSGRPARAGHAVRIRSTRYASVSFQHLFLLTLGIIPMGNHPARASVGGIVTNISILHQEMLQFYICDITGIHMAA